MLGVVERGGGVLERGELLSGPARLEELALVLEPLVVGLVENAVDMIAISRSLGGTVSLLRIVPNTEFQPWAKAGLLRSIRSRLRSLPPGRRSRIALTMSGGPASSLSGR
jgi:hypothetical protein